jgi:hypothetical protein
VLGSVCLNHVLGHPVLAKLGLDHAPPTRTMTIALLAPPSREGGIVEVAKLGEPIEGGLDLGIGHGGAAEPSLDFPPGAWASGEEADGDLEG